MASCCKTALQNTISATYAITFLPGGSFLLPSICSFIVSLVLIYRAIFLFLWLLN